MSDEIEMRDRQVAISNAWHNKTIIASPVTRELAMPYNMRAEQVFCELTSDQLGDTPRSLRLPNIMQLVADDDELPIAMPYNADTYFPVTLDEFWELVGKVNGTLESAGTLRDRKWLFASVKVGDEFKVGQREFRNYVSILDSVGHDMSLQVCYTNTCTVCANTFRQTLADSTKLGRIQHRGDFTERLKLLHKMLDNFNSVAKRSQEIITEAATAEADEGEARCWLAGVTAFAARTSKLSMGDVRAVARMGELYRKGAGNEGKTRLDTFQGLTQFHTHESGAQRTGTDQWYVSEFGTSAAVKEAAFERLSANQWDATAAAGKSLLAKAGAYFAS